MANELDLRDEMELLTQLTMEGRIAFHKSFRLRYHVLRNIPLHTIQEIMRKVRMDSRIVSFIREHSEDCAIVTGNLDVWVQPIMEKLGCSLYSSTSRLDADGNLQLDCILDKGKAIRQMKSQGCRVIAIGEGFNDVPMFEEADISISYGGVHRPVDKAISVSDYVVLEGGALCRLLSML